MAKRTQELKPDTVLKNYWSDNEQFADLFNAVLFEGKQVIRPEELEEVDTEESTVLENRDYAESIKASRDNIKIQKKSTAYDVQFVLLGMEHQEKIHYAMPMRVMGYDYASYKKQYDSNAKNYKTKEGLTEDEYLSRMKKTDKFVPVITVVVYYGEKAWDGAVSLYGMLNIPQEMKLFVNDYKMHLVEARQNNLIFHNINNTDLFNLLEIVLDKSISKNEAKKRAIEYSEEHKTDKSVIMTVAGATNTKLDYNALGRGDGTMCTLFEEIAKESESKGKEIGQEIGKEIGKAIGQEIGKAIGEAKGIIETGFEFGLSKSDILERLQKKLNISLQQAQEYLEMFGKQTVR